MRGLVDRCFSLNNELGGYLAAQSLLRLKHRKIACISGPLGFVDAQQRLQGHKRALAEAGVPDELSIVSFDDAPISRYVYPKLSTVHYPITDMSRMAARWVLKNVYEQENLDVQQAFEPSFVARDSVSRPG